MTPELVEGLQGARDFLNTSPETQTMRDKHPGGEFSIRPLVTNGEEGNRAAYRPGSSGQHGVGNAADVEIVGPDGNRINDEYQGAKLLDQSGAFNRIGSYVNESGIPRWHVDMKDSYRSSYWINAQDPDKYPDGIRYYDSSSRDFWLRDIKQR
ncbi:MAG: hypothetical protein OEZ43_21790 [Gammaproteobacteria bacterium]|nr:hypothetical protein [Gammaproteobacteria bacterium]